MQEAMEINNRTAERILAKLGRPVGSPYVWYYVQDGALYGVHLGRRSRYSALSGDWEYSPGATHKLLDVSPDEAELLLRLSQLDDEDDRRRADEAEQARLTRDAEREDFLRSATPPPGYTLNKYGELLDEHGNYVLTLPTHLHGLRGEELQNAILSLLEDCACYD